MFQNPIATQTTASQAGVVDPPNPLPMALAGVAEAGVRLWSHYKAGEAQKASEKANEFGFQLGVTRLQEFNTIREERGQLFANQWLNEKYLEDVRDLDPTARASYMEGMKGILGKSPVEMENALAIKQMEAQQQEYQALLREGSEWVAGSGVDPNGLDEEQLISIAMRNRGRAAQAAAYQTQLAIAQSEWNLESQERARNTQIALNSFGAAFDTRISGNLLKVKNAYRSGRYSVPVVNPETGVVEPQIFTGEVAMKRAREDAINNILEAKSQLPSLMRTHVLNNGGDPSSVSAADIQLMQDQLDRVQDFITGADLGKLRDDQFNALLSMLSLDYLQNASDHGIELAIAKVTGAPMASQDVVMASRLRPEGMATLGDPMATFLRSVDDTYKFGAASTAVQSPDPKAAMRENTQTVIHALDQRLLDNDEKRARSAEAIYRSLAETNSPNPEIRRLANSNAGAIEIHRVLARDPKKAKQIGQDLAEAAARNGSSLEELYINEINNLSRQSIIPSLGLSGLRRQGDFKGSEVISVDVHNGRVRFKLSDARYVKSDAGPYGRDDYNMGYNRRKFQLQKAEDDLNTILLSYKNVTGADGAALAAAAVAAFNEVLGKEGGEQ